MLIKAHQKYIRQSPRKIRAIAASLRQLSPTAALDQLRLLNKRASLPLLKTLKQAIANAVNNSHVSRQNLTIKELRIDPGATYKRWQPVSRGRAHSIFKRTSHITVVLEASAAAQKTPAKPAVSS